MLKHQPQMAFSASSVFTFAQPNALFMDKLFSKKKSTKDAPDVMSFSISASCHIPNVTGRWSMRWYLHIHNLFSENMFFALAFSPTKFMK